MKIILKKYDFFFQNGFIGRSKMCLLNFSFVMVFIIHKMLKNHLNYLKDNIFEWFFKKYNRLLFFKKSIYFFHRI